MTKDISRRSSVSGSAHASLPPTNGTDSPLQDPQQSSEPSLAARRSPSPVRDAPKSTDSDAPSVIAAESQPMTASNSTSSSPAPNNFTTGASATGAVPYGTRSRNRTGGARPNYAEDKEIDMDFEVAPAAKEPNGRKPARGADQSPSSQTETGRATSSVRRAGIDTSQSVTVQNHYKEQIPGTSTFSANLTSATIASQPSTKKRKAGSASQSQTHTPTHGYSTDSSTRRRGIPAHAVMEYRESNMLSFENCGARLKDKKLIADDGTVLEANDHIYLVCEPPGEPYYLGRIMEFLHTNNDKSEPIDSIRLNWYYRPKDIGRKVNDTRQVFASMHSDISPLTSVRGKCQIRHKSEVDSVDELKGMPDCFWYEKLYDRYIHRYYDVIPTSRVINVPSEVKKVLDERWKFIVVEPVRGKELTSAVKSCKRCSKYCANNDSVDCAVCRSTYHMSCVNPPLLKKPSRGFAWACGPCSKAQEKKLEARNTPNASDAAADAEDDDFLDEEDDFVGPLGDSLETGQTSPNRSPEPELTIHPGTTEQIHQAGLWLFRYLGIHCRVEDALDYDDRIYPRASSRLGPRHQANVMPWPGRPVEYVKATEVKRKYGKGGYQKKEIKPAKETVPVSDTENGSREERPKWVMDAPPGYISRGEDYPNHDPKNTAQLLFNLDGDRTENVVAEGNDSGSAAPKISSSEELHDYMERVKGLAKPLGLPELSTNLQDIGLELLHSNAYNAEAALKAVSTSDKSIFKEPEFTPAELKRFEEGVAKYGSEWHSIKTHVRCQEAWKIVRFYYTWKKTERGKQIWGNYSGRKGKKEAKKSELSEGKLQDDVADEHDDSAFDNDKALERKKGFQCKFCATQSSRVWRRAPNTPAGTLVTENSNGKTAVKEKAPQLLVSLCWRCAELWRRYAVQWEEVEEMKKKVQQPGRAFKRKIDEEIIKEIQAANEAMGQTNSGPSGSISANGTPAPAISSASLGTEPPRKKLKSAPDKDAETQDSSVAGTAGQQRKKALAEKPNSAPPVPEPPKPRLLPCAVCGDMDPVGDRLSCRDCRMTVHRNCYGISENRSPSKWICDMCSNDKNPLLAIRYKCALCPVIYTEQDFVEPPKNSSKKKNEKDRERDRIERESAQRAADFFKQKQADMNKPTNPREPLKRTTGNNWVHVTCAVFTPEIKFGRADALAPSEGFQTINPTRFDEVCALCNTKTGACVSCHSCRATVHVECAHQAGYVLGFDIIPVKGSRREQFNIVTINGETGTMTAAIWCKEHAPTKTIIHRMNDIVDDTGLNVLQLYVRNFKQADLTQTGTMRKAALVYQSAKAANPPASNLPSHRRTSTAATINGSSLPSRGSVSHIKIDEPLDETIPLATNEIERTCVTCGIDVSPKWWPCPPVIIPGLPNGDHHTYGHELILPGVATSESGTGHVALAAAALHQNGHNSVPNSSNFQCHQCHWKKMRKEPTPAPAALPPREESRLSIPPPVSGAAMTDANISSAVPPYGWSPQPSYPPNGPYNNWTHHSPVPPTAAPVHQLNGHHSPHASAGPPISGQPPFRQPSQQAQLVQPVPPIQAIPPVQIVQPGQQIQPVQPLLRSPHQNGQMVQPINGYPPSPHRGMSSSSHHMQNGPYASFASTQPPPQHLTNGGPPPRAPEHPFSQSTAHTHPRPPFALPPHGSPPVQREPNPQGREAGNQQNGARPNDGRVNGGASASPSLRNLLS